MQTEKDCVTFLQVFDKIGTSAIYSLIFVLILHGIIITCQLSCAIIMPCNIRTKSFEYIALVLSNTCINGIAIYSQNCVQIWKGRDRKTGFLRVRHLAWPFTILQNDNITISWDFFRLTAPAAMLGHLGAVQISLFEFYESV